MYQTHMWVVGIVVFIIFHVPSQCVDKCSVVIAMSRMNYHTSWLVHYHQRIVFVDNIERNIFGEDFVFVTRTIHHDGNNIEWLNFVAALHRFPSYLNTMGIGCSLNSVA